MKAVEQALAKTEAARRVLWIDACRDEPGKGVGEARSFANLQAAAGTRLLLSTKAGKVSYEDEQLKQGLFSYYLVKGLQGDAAGPDGLVTFQDLATYVTLRVRSRSLEIGHVQVPYEAGEASGDFLLARASAARVPDPSPTPAANDHGPQPGSTKVNPKDGQRYVWIPPGSFIMGCSPGDTECYDEEKPAHNVSITKGFWLGQTPVTVAAWKRYRTATGGSALPAGDSFGRKLNQSAGNDSVPAVAMTWEEAKGFCEWSGGRLPTEAEWEYAARAGSAGARYGDLDAVAWYADNSGSQRIDSTQMWQTDQANYDKRLYENGNGPKPVGTKERNAWNLYDMLGNVWQWTSDWYGEKYYGQQESTDPQGPPGGDKRVLRGGSWYFNPRSVRVSNRNRNEPGNRVSSVGARCVGE